MYSSILLHVYIIDNNFLLGQRERDRKGFKGKTDIK